MARKRPAAELAAEREPRRRSGRASAPKSAYFEDPDSEVEEEDVQPTMKKRAGKAKQLLKEQGRSKAAIKKEEKEKEEEEDDDDDDDDDDDVRRVEILPLEKLRDEGGVGYEAHKVHRNTLLFLKDLKANNQRSWLKAHDGEYRRALKDWQSFVEVTTATLIDADETVPELPVKDVIFRIHRDIRFSKDPTPYKPHFSAAWSRTGRKGPYAAYYLHCEPGACFIGGGLWQPEAGQLARLRESIDARPGRWRRVLNDALFREVFLPSSSSKKKDGGEEDAVRTFVKGNQRSALKKKPMGYEITHRDIELLKLRSFTVTTKLKDGDFSSDAVQETIGRTMRALCPFVSFLNSIVMPDPNFDGEEDDEGEEDEDDEEEEEEELVEEKEEEELDEDHE